MNGTIQLNYGSRSYALPAKPSEADRAGMQSGKISGSFLDWAMRISGNGGSPDIAKEEKMSNTDATDAYMEHLKNKYGRVTIESIGKDQSSLTKAAGRMSGQDVIIAPNILADMANDPKKALYYEQKIDYYFQKIIPRENAFCAARGLVFEPCGVVVHEDGTVTYICGCSDSPERVAEVNRINREKAAKKAAQMKLYQEHILDLERMRNFEQYNLFKL